MSTFTKSIDSSIHYEKIADQIYTRLGPDLRGLDTYLNNIGDNIQSYLSKKVLVGTKTQSVDDLFKNNKWITNFKQLEEWSAMLASGASAVDDTTKNEMLMQFLKHRQVEKALHNIEGLDINKLKLDYMGVNSLLNEDPNRVILDQIAQWKRSGSLKLSKYKDADGTFKSLSLILNFNKESNNIQDIIEAMSNLNIIDKSQAENLQDVYTKYKLNFTDLNKAFDILEEELPDDFPLLREMRFIFGLDTNAKYTLDEINYEYDMERILDPKRMGPEEYKEKVLGITTDSVIAKNPSHSLIVNSKKYKRVAAQLADLVNNNATRDEIQKAQMNLRRIYFEELKGRDIKSYMDYQREISLKRLTTQLQSTPYNPGGKSLMVLISILMTLIHILKLKMNMIIKWSEIKMQEF